MGDIELARIVGNDNILDSPTVLESYSKDSSFVNRIMPKCVVKPGNVDEVQRIVKWANETLTPLVPISSGPPHFRGDTVPSVAGAVIIDLSKMKRVIRIDPRNKIAMIEPGVTFDELQSALAKEGLCAYMPLAPRCSKSVIGSMLEREPMIRPGHHWDSTDPLLCTEVVFGTGDKFRTGEASGPDTVEEQWAIGRVQMNPFGHSHVDFQRLVSGAQGTIGIVTWATIKCSYLSKLTRALLVPSAGIEPLIDLSYKFLKFRFGGSLFMLNGLNLACLLGNGLQEIQELRNILPPWILFSSFEGYGILPEDKVEFEESDFRAMAQSCHLQPEATIPGAIAEEMLQLLSQPSPEHYWKMRSKGGFQDLFFLTTLDKTPGFISALSDLAQQHSFPIENLGVYIQPIVQGTSCHCEFNLYYDPTQSTELEATKRFITQGSEEIAKMGGFFSRPYGAWKDVAYRRAANTLVMQKKIKQIFDPRGILNPGKLCFPPHPPLSPKGGGEG
jgi:FAD/FMN-containing dehydrogenase